MGGAVQVASCERSEQVAFSNLRGNAERASEVRVSTPIELRQGSGAQPPENFEVFVHYIPHTSTFGNREQFLDQFFDNLKIGIFVSV